jgi:transcriptional regulator MraZ
MWVIVAAPSRKTGVAGLLPLRHPGRELHDVDGGEGARRVAFRGQYDYSLDAKNRLNIPPKFRASFSEGLVLSIWFDPCITIWTPVGFEAISGSYLAGENPLSKQHRDLVRFFNHSSWDAELDGSGRVTLNPKLVDYAGIEKAVVVAGTHDRVEVWNPDRWRADQEELGAHIAQVAEGLGHPS